jgi:hypothetical protein
VTQPVLFAVEDGEHSAVTEGGLYAPGITCRAQRRRLGDASEFEFCKQAALHGWRVKHFGGFESNYDAIVQKPDMPLLTVQIKRAWRSKPDESNGAYAVGCKRPGNSGELYSLHAFDVLAAHLTDVNCWLFFTRPELGDRKNVTYVLPSYRKNKRQERCCSDRDPDNWELLDQVAAMYSQESSGVTQPMSHPIPQNLPIP